MRLRGADLEAILAFLSDIVERDCERPHDDAMLELLRRLIPSDQVVYQDADLINRRLAGPPHEDDARYWKFGPCPISQHRLRTGDTRTLRMTDVVSWSEYRELPVYKEYFEPARVTHILDVSLPSRPGQHRSLVFFRDTGGSDFTARDRKVLDVLRPHLIGLERRAKRRHEAGRGTGGSEARQADAGSGLTPREHEVVVLVAAGMTNSQIAAELWVAPSTVKKHLENVYDKLGVNRRTAAAVMLSATD